ncbi:hypothetical protein JCM33374_g4154 [Metschnikowia sp. JCM 33374]|nr:hypothetical protein JCM33374_g4154 [Metschnikowia sp. JCM 33374]
MEDFPPAPEAPDLELESSESESEQEIPNPGYTERLVDAKENLAYSGLFNDHVTSFFNLEYLEKNPKRLAPTTILYPSKNTLDAAYYLPRPPNPTRRRKKGQTAEQTQAEASTTKQASSTTSDPNPQATTVTGDELPGTLWTVDEKEKFFECLARFSIHRLDEFLPFLPNKSRIEIEAYYHLLKSELRRLTKYKTFSTFRRTHEGKMYPTTFTMRVFDRGTSYSSIPAAYEVDDEWMEFEEQQSHLLTVKESAGANAALRRETSMLTRYENAPSQDTPNIVNVETAARISYLCNGNRITPILRNKTPPRFALSSLVFLDELVKVRVRDVMLALIMRMGTNNIGPPTDPEMIIEPPGNVVKPDNKYVSKRDIWRAVEDLRLFETKKAGFNARYPRFRTPLLSTYKYNVVESLQLDKKKYVPKPDYTGKYFDIMKIKYQDSDHFLRMIDPDCSRLEISDSLVAHTASGVMEAEDGDVEYSSEDELQAPRDWELPFPWESSEKQKEPPELSLETDASQQANNGSASVEPHSPGNDPESPSYSTSSEAASDQLIDEISTGTENSPVVEGDSDGPQKYLEYSELKPTETFSRKRTLEDVLIEDSLDGDIMKFTEYQDRKRNLKQLKMAKDAMGIDNDISGIAPEKHQSYMTQSDIQKAWEKSFPGY